MRGKRYTLLGKHQQLGQHIASVVGWVHLSITLVTVGWKKWQAGLGDRRTPLLGKGRSLLGTYALGWLQVLLLSPSYHLCASPFNWSLFGDPEV